jgi:hypothetical protein
VRAVAGAGKRITHGLPDIRVTRVGLDQPGKIGENFLDQAVPLDQVTIGMQAALKIARCNVLTCSQQDRVGAI